MFWKTRLSPHPIPLYPTVFYCNLLYLVAGVSNCGLVWDNRAGAIRGLALASLTAIQLLVMVSSNTMIAVKVRLSPSTIRSEHTSDAMQRRQIRVAILVSKYLHITYVNCVMSQHHPFICTNPDSERYFYLIFQRRFLAYQSEHI